MANYACLGKAVGGVFLRGAFLARGGGVGGFKVSLMQARIRFESFFPAIL